MSSTFDKACCAECHFAWEERVLLPALPIVIAEKIRAEHRRIEAGGHQPNEVKAHAKWEEKVLREHLPPRLYREMVLQHRKVDRPLSLGAPPRAPWPLLIVLLPIYLLSRGGSSE